MLEEELDDTASEPKAALDGQDPWAGSKFKTEPQSRSEGDEWKNYLDKDGNPHAPQSGGARTKGFVNKDPPPSWDGSKPKGKWKPFRRELSH